MFQFFAECVFFARFFFSFLSTVSLHTCFAGCSQFFFSCELVSVAFPFYVLRFARDKLISLLASYVSFSSSSLLALSTIPLIVQK